MVCWHCLIYSNITAAHKVHNLIENCSYDSITLHHFSWQKKAFYEDQVNYSSTSALTVEISV